MDDEPQNLVTKPVHNTRNTQYDYQKNQKRLTTLRHGIPGPRWVAAKVKIAFTMMALTSLLLSGSTTAAEPPEFFKNSLPEHAIGKMLKSYGAFQGEGAQLDTKTRELIALSVSAQVPCAYCVYAHRNNALKAGATEAEVREAVAAGASDNNSVSIAIDIGTPGLRYLCTLAASGDALSDESGWRNGFFKHRFA